MNDARVMLCAFMLVLTSCLGILDPFAPRGAECVTPMNLPAELQARVDAHGVRFDMVREMPAIAHSAVAVTYPQRILLLKETGKPYVFTRLVVHELTHADQWRRRGNRMAIDYATGMGSGALEAEAERAERAWPDHQHLTWFAPCVEE